MAREGSRDVDPRVYLDIQIPKNREFPGSPVRGQFIKKELEKSPPDVREAARKIEEEYTQKAELIVREGAENRLDLLEKVFKRVLEAVDLDSREKVLAALAEVIPFVGVLYAVSGKRLTFERSDAGWPLPRLENINWTERGLYLISEIVGSGHVIVGLKRFAFKGIASITRRRLAQVNTQQEEGHPLAPGFTNLIPTDAPKMEVEKERVEVEIK